MHFRVFDCASSFQVPMAKLQRMQRHLSAWAVLETCLFDPEIQKAGFVLVWIQHGHWEILVLQHEFNIETPSCLFCTSEFSWNVSISDFLPCARRWAFCWDHSKFLSHQWMSHIFTGRGEVHKRQPEDSSHSTTSGRLRRNLTKFYACYFLYGRRTEPLTFWLRSPRSSTWYNGPNAGKGNGKPCADYPGLEDLRFLTMLHDG